MKLRPRLTYANVMSTIAVVAALCGGAFAVAALPDKSGKINACYVKSGKRKGSVRLLVSGTKCAKGEKLLSWNQRGPQGDPGAPGAPNPNAANSDQLDGLDSTAFLPVGGLAQSARDLIGISRGTIGNGLMWGRINAVFSPGVAGTRRYASPDGESLDDDIQGDVEYGPSGALNPMRLNVELEAAPDPSGSTGYRFRLVGENGADLPLACDITGSATKCSAPGNLSPGVTQPVSAIEIETIGGLPPAHPDARFSWSAVHTAYTG